MSENTFPVRDDRWTSGEDVQAHVAEGPEENEVEGHIARPGQDRLQARNDRIRAFDTDGEDDVEGHIRAAVHTTGENDGDAGGQAPLRNA